MLDPGGMAKDDRSNFLRIKTTFKRKKKSPQLSVNLKQFSLSQKSENVGEYSDLTEGETGFQPATIPEDQLCKMMSPPPLHHLTDTCFL